MGDPDARVLGAAANPALPGVWVDRLVGAAGADVAEVLADRADLGRARALVLAERFGDALAVPLARRGLLAAEEADPVRWPDAAIALLDEGAGRPAWARLLAADPSPGRRERLAACPGLPTDVEEALAADRDVGVLAELAAAAGPLTAGRLAAHPHAEVRRAAAGNPRTPPAALAALLTGEGLPAARACRVCDREPVPFVHAPDCPRTDCDLLPGDACDGTHESTVHAVRQAALDNPATPPGEAARFAGHPSAILRWTLARRRDLPAAASARLAADPVPGVRADLAGNPALDPPLFAALAADRDPEVRRALARNPRIPLDVLVPLARTARVGSDLLPRVAAAAPAEIERLAGSPDPVARVMAARRRDLPQPLRDRLAADGSAAVAKAVAPHPGLTDPQLRALLDRHGTAAVVAVAGNPDAGPQLLELIASAQAPSRRALRAIARHPSAPAGALAACLGDARARRDAARHPALPAEALARLLDHPDPEVAEAAAANPSLPPAVLVRLAQAAAPAG